MIPDDMLGQLPTPCLVIDLPVADRNIQLAAGRFSHGPVRLRPHFKAHKTSRLLLRQLEAGGCSGVTCQTTWEALAAARAGVADILITNQIVDRFALADLGRVSRLARVTVTVDALEQVPLVAEAARQAGSSIGVVVELDVGIGRAGLPVDSPQLVPIAQAIDSSAGLAFRGLQAYEGHAVMREDRSVRQTLVWQAARQTAYERDRLAVAGFNCEIISGGGTGTWDLTAENGVHNEVQAGSYVLMDATYAALGLPFAPAIYCAASITSRREAHAAVANAGLKELSVEYGMPKPVRPGLRVIHVSDEHSRLAVADGIPLAIGDVVLMIPGHLDPTINLHPALFVYDPAVGLERWPVDGRRQFD